MARNKRRLTKKKLAERKLSPKVLAIDLGGKMGYAISWANREITSGTVKLVKASTKKHKETPGLRFVRFRDWLENIDGVHYVYYEEVHAHAGTDAAHAYGGFRALLMEWAERNKIPYGSFGVGTIKKRATGKGNSKKPAMIEAADIRFGTENNRITDDNQADALWILVLALEKLKIES